MTDKDKMTVQFFRPSISDGEIAEVTDTLRSGWLTTGPKVSRFEADFAEAVGARFAVAVNSCTAALHLALESVGIERGDLVLVPTMTFAATAEVVRYFDAVPVFVDCDDTLCIDPETLERTIVEISNRRPTAGLKPPYGRVKAIFPMHYGGFCCRMDRIMSIADEHGIPVIEDCAHAFPAYYRPNGVDNWIHSGRFGIIGCFSFYANKCITTGEGGMIVTDEETLAKRMRLMSLHGMDRDSWKRYTAQGSWYYEIVAPGYKYNFTDIAASIGIHQLKRAEEFRSRREEIASRYTRQFNRLPAVQTPPNDNRTRIHSWHLYFLKLNLDRITISRDEFIEELKRRGVYCSVHWLPLHMNPYYRQKYGLGEGLFPNAEEVWRQLVSLPIYPAMTDDEVEYVIREVKDVIRCSSR